MKTIININELDDFITTNHNDMKIMMLYFGASWCGPCKLLKERLKSNDTYNIMPRLSVAYIDIDNELNEELVKRYKVNILPTQVYIKLENNKVKELKRIEGYDFTKLKLEYDLCNN